MNTPRQWPLRSTWPGRPSPGRRTAGCQCSEMRQRAAVTRTLRKRCTGDRRTSLSRGRRSAARGDVLLSSLAEVAGGMDEGGLPSRYYILLRAVLIYSHVTEMTEMEGNTYIPMMLYVYYLGPRSSDVLDLGLLFYGRNSNYSIPNIVQKFRRDP